MSIDSWHGMNMSMTELRCLCDNIKSWSTAKSMCNELERKMAKEGAKKLSLKCKPHLIFSLMAYSQCKLKNRLVVLVFWEMFRKI